MGHLIQRSKRIILILGGVAALAGGPAVSIAAAATNNGGGSGSGYDCALAAGEFDLVVWEYQDAVKSGDGAAAAILKLNAIQWKLDATDAGCDTSTWTVPTIIIGTRFHLPITAVGTQFTTS